MTPERWQQINQLWDAALELGPDDRAAFLNDACAGNDALREEVESLIASHQQARSFIEVPPYEVSEALIAYGRARLRSQDIGPYQVMSEIGRGGMGEVYLARDTRLGRHVALKLLPAEFTKDEYRVRRFEREARAASALNHPNILTVYEIGQVDDIRFIATEFIEGETLSHRLASTRMNSREVLDIAIQVASALEAAHAAGIVHRDIKPENIMLRPDGLVKVLDFGLAKVIPQKTSLQSELQTQSLLTEPGAILGTVPYMSPEQMRGEVLDTRSDTFSFGVVLYEMTNGHQPFARQGVAGAISAILTQEPSPLARYSPEAPAELQRIVSKALQKERKERYQTIKELLIDLESLKDKLDVQAKLGEYVPSESGCEAAIATNTGQPTMTTSNLLVVESSELLARSRSSAEVIVSAIKRHKKGIALALGILIALIAGIIMGLLITYKQPKPIAPLQPMKIARLTAIGKAMDAAISPDGKYAVYMMNDIGRKSLWVRHIATSSEVQIIPPAEVEYYGLTFSHDSSYVYYVRAENNKSSGDLYQVPMLGGASRKILKNLEGPVSFSPDGKQFAFVRDDKNQGALMIANADGTGERLLATRKLPDSLASPAWSPDGKVIACSATSFTSGFHTNLIVVAVDNGEEEMFDSQRWSLIRQLAWLEDGSGLVLSASQQSSLLQIWQVSYPGGEVRRVTNDLNNYFGISVAADSSTLLTVQYDKTSSIWVAPNGEASRATQITSGPGKSDPSWTSDGKIVYASSVGDDSDIWVMEADGTAQKQLTFDASAFQPLATHDGRCIIFVSGREESPHIWRTDSSGGNPKQLTSGSAEFEPACSPDGNWVVFRSFDSGKRTLWKVAIEGGDPVQLTYDDAIRPTISPDGKLIACYYGLKLTVISFEGGQPIKTFDSTLSSFGHIRWAADGRALTYIQTQRAVSNIWSQPLDGGSPKQLTNFKSDRIFWFDWSRDGKHLALSRGAVSNDVMLISGFR